MDVDGRRETRGLRVSAVAQSFLLLPLQAAFLALLPLRMPARPLLGMPRLKGLRTESQTLSATVDTLEMSARLEMPARQVQLGPGHLRFFGSPVQSPTHFIVCVCFLAFPSRLCLCHMMLFCCVLQWFPLE